MEQGKRQGPFPGSTVDIRCRGCKENFKFSAGWQRKLQEEKHVNWPRWCRNCRSNRPNTNFPEGRKSGNKPVSFRKEPEVSIRVLPNISSLYSRGRVLAFDSKENKAYLKDHSDAKVTVFSWPEHSPAPPLFSMVHYKGTDVVKVTPLVKTKSEGKDVCHRLLPECLATVAETLGADADFTSPSNTSILDCAIDGSALEKSILDLEDELLATLCTRGKPQTRDELKANADFQEMLRVGVKPIFMTAHEKEGSAVITYHDKQVKQLDKVAEHYPDGQFTRTWFQLYPVLPGSTPSNLLTRHSTKLITNSARTWISKYHIFDKPLMVVPTDRKTWFPLWCSVSTTLHRH
jgi:hypothetical protein